MSEGEFEALSELSIRGGEVDVPVTATMGLTASHGEEGFQAIIQLGGQPLYSAESKGRNRIVCLS